MPASCGRGLISDRVRPRYEASGIKLFSDTGVLEHFERTGDVVASS
jgi:hypothetical protein